MMKLEQHMQDVELKLHNIKLLMQEKVFQLNTQVGQCGLVAIESVICYCSLISVILILLAMTQCPFPAQDVFQHCNKQFVNAIL